MGAAAGHSAAFCDPGTPGARPRRGLEDSTRGGGLGGGATSTFSREREMADSREREMVDPREREMVDSSEREMIGERGR